MHTLSYIYDAKGCVHTTTEITKWTTDKQLHLLAIYPDLAHKRMNECWFYKSIKLTVINEHSVSHTHSWSQKLI